MPQYFNPLDIEILADTIDRKSECFVLVSDREVKGTSWHRRENRGLAGG